MASLLPGSARLRSPAYAFIAIILASGCSPKSDEISILGEWEFVKSVYDGKEHVLRGRSTLRFTSVYIVYPHRKEPHDSYKLNQTETPRSIDVKVAQPGEADDGKTMLGIYELKGDDLLICIAKPGLGRPKRLESEPGSGHNLMILKRSKAE
jgi:uncharacterized protein (TIGR03067 family)